MNKRWAKGVAGLLLVLLTGMAWAAAVPRVTQGRGGQLVVDGKPFLILGGELGNSSAGTMAQADAILPRLAALNVNTVLMPVTWDQLEPREGHYDFRLVDHWIRVARKYHLHVVVLWFGSWKNAFSEYAPGWVKADPARFPRAMSANGLPLEILSTFGEATLRKDAAAFSALMGHLCATDEAHTVLMAQVENEVGIVGDRRDRSVAADRAFASPVPAGLMRALNGQRQLTPELAAHFDPKGSHWSEVFGDAADEVFMAWRYATAIDQVAAAGKAQCPLPMYVNAQLPAPGERAGEYPSGGPHPYFLQVYRATAPHVDFQAPDIYWPQFAYWVGRYQALGNPAFVPEARLDVAPYNALYLFGEARGFGFSPFGIDSLSAPSDKAADLPLLAQVYGAIAELGDALPEAQHDGRTRGLVLHADSPRPRRTVALGGYLFTGSLSRSWTTGMPEARHGAMLLMQTAADEFLVVGMGLDVSVRRDPDVDDRLAVIGSIEEVARSGNGWRVVRRLNGDQSDQGRRLLTDPGKVHVYRLRMQAVAPTR